MVPNRSYKLYFDSPFVTVERHHTNEISNRFGGRDESCQQATDENGGKNLFGRRKGDRQRGREVE